MKEEYVEVEVELEIVEFENKDTIVTSDDTYIEAP